MPFAHLVSAKSAFVAHFRNLCSKNAVHLPNMLLWHAVNEHFGHHAMRTRDYSAHPSKQYETRIILSWENSGIRYFAQHWKRARGSGSDHNLRRARAIEAYLADEGAFPCTDGANVLFRSIWQRFEHGAKTRAKDAAPRRAALQSRADMRKDLAWQISRTSRR